MKLFYKDYSEKSTTIFKAINTTPPINRLTVKPINKPSIKKKQGLPANSFNKQIKKSWV